MMYADYRYYTEDYAGEVIASEQMFNRHARRASALLDMLTFFRIPRPASAAVMDACCAVCDVYAKSDVRDGIASETNDGYSVTYAQEARAEAAYRAAMDYLLPTGLCYRGEDAP